MQRRKILGALLGTVVLSACSATRTPATSGSVTVGGLSARTVRELGRVHRMLGKAPLPSEVRRSLQPGSPLPANLVFHAIPPAMLASLPVIDGHEWRIAGIDLLLIDSNTMVVADILRGPFR